MGTYFFLFMTQIYIFQYVHTLKSLELKMNIDITNSNDSISNGEHDGLTMVTNSEEDELNKLNIQGFLDNKRSKEK